ncbi:MAG: hypothetical protein Q8Q69_06950 [Nitrosopumilaceae archaeon]|jgi:uncharacterized membrane protein YczE|nr:hypothetical protein [Nitrosopumilaceae archaeon]
MIIKLPISIIVIGVIVISFGIIFHLQGQGVVGPQESFMYENPNWITYGQQIAVIGMLIIGGGIGVKIYFTKKR